MPHKIPRLLVVDANIVFILQEKFYQKTANQKTVESWD
jgi:hypothetical protein